MAPPYACIDRAHISKYLRGRHRNASAVRQDGFSDAVLHLPPGLFSGQGSRRANTPDSCSDTHNIHTSRPLSARFAVRHCHGTDATSETGHSPNSVVHVQERPHGAHERTLLAAAQVNDEGEIFVAGLESVVRVRHQIGLSNSPGRSPESMHARVDVKFFLTRKTSQQVFVALFQTPWKHRLSFSFFFKAVLVHGMNTLVCHCRLARARQVQKRAAAHAVPEKQVDTCFGCRWHFSAKS